MPNLDAIYDRLIEEFNHLHRDHQNRILAMRILETLKAKGVSIRAYTKKLNAIRSTDIYVLLYNEVDSTLSSSIRFRNIMSGEAEGSKKKQFLESFKVFQSEVGYNPREPSTRPYVIWDLNLAPDGK